jgi:hypothetical protein
MDLEKFVMDAFSNGSICSFILSDSSQSALSTPPNRSNDTFDATITTATNPFIINIKNFLVKASANAPAFATTGKPASLMSNKLLISNMKFSIRPNQPPDVFIADFEVELNQPLKNRFINNIVIKDIQITTDSTSATNAKKIIGCGGLGEVAAQRISFTTSSTWTVPVGIRKVFVSMAGAGGSGFGWRIISHYSSGHSGGYIFSQPLKVTPGEVLQVIVGTGGKGYSPVSTGVPANPGVPFYIYTSPTGDDGLGGYPGGASQLISPTQGVLLECDGGSGAYAMGIDNFTGGLVAGNVPGARSGSGVPTSASPNRVATGAYATAGGPGSCGPGQIGYGKGNAGVLKYNLPSGTTLGGSTPFGYGSGGDILILGCYVDKSTIGKCIYPTNGRDGVVYIDIF